MAVTFSPLGGKLPVDVVYVRLLRWVGDGFQPIYSTLITSSEVPTRPTPVPPVPGRGGARAQRCKVGRCRLTPG
jgi:hypothetical protein